MRLVKRRGSAFTFALAAVACSAACTLDVDTPVQPPPDAWDPSLNTHPEAAALQELLERYVHAGLPGVVLFTRTPQGLWNGAAGYAKIETDEPMLPTHRHHSASVTKMYTAAAVMLLVEDGVVELDAGINEYLPEPVYGPIPNGDVATVRQLLGHTSGIPDFSADLAYDLDFLNDPMGSFSPDRLLSYLHGQPSMAEPGKGYFYSNANYFLLALLMDELTAGGHARVITERVLQPLGLEGTCYRDDVDYPLPPGLVNSYQDLTGDGRLVNVSDLTAHNAEIFFGHSGLIATSEDFAAFIEGLLEGRVLRSASVVEMTRWRERSRSGLGLNYVETPYGPGVGHSGGDVGVRSEVRHFPGRDATVVLLMNGGDGGVPDRLFRDLWDETLEVVLGAG